MEPEDSNKLSVVLMDLHVGREIGVQAGFICRIEAENKITLEISRII